MILFTLKSCHMAYGYNCRSLRVYECMNYFLNVTTVHCFIGSPLYDSCALYYSTRHWEAVIEMLNIHCFFLCWQCWGGTNRNLYFDWQHDWANQRPGYSQYTRLLIKYSSAEKLPCSNWGMTKFLIHVPQRYTACVLVLVETYHTYYSTFLLFLLHLWLYNIYLFNLI